MSRNRTVARVRRILADGQWHNARQIARRMRMSTAGITARIRDLRKAAHGCSRIEVRRPSKPGVYDYRMAP
jgi:hypothetical protein